MRQSAEDIMKNLEEIRQQSLAKRQRPLTSQQRNTGQRQRVPLDSGSNSMPKIQNTSQELVAGLPAILEQKKPPVRGKSSSGVRPPAQR